MHYETKQKVMKRVALTFYGMALMVLAVALPTEVMAQYTYKFRDTLGTYEVRFTPASKTSRFTHSHTKPLLPHTHELRLGTSFGGTTCGTLIAHNYDINYNGNNLDRPMEFGPTHRYTLSLDYGYWVNEWLSVGASVTYMAGLRNIFDNLTKERMMTLHDGDLSIMPIVRMAWYRRGIVQLYSSIGVGIDINIWELNYDGRDIQHDIYFALDTKFIGIAVGRKCFGFVEVGYGSRGLINAGIGVRINNKVR